MRLWKRELQSLASETGLDIVVSHLPPGTSKWNKIEHRLFSFISQNWRARPLVSYRVIVQLIAATTTKTGLEVHCELDTGVYPKGIAVSDEDMAAIKLTPGTSKWNKIEHLIRRRSATATLCGNPSSHQKRDYYLPQFLGITIEACGCPVFVT